MSPAYQTTPPPAAQANDSLSAILASHMNGQPQSMDGRQQEYQQTGLSSPYTYSNHASEASPADQPSAAPYQQDVKFGSDVRSSTFSSSATPNSEYGVAPQSARSGSFPEYIQQQQQQRPPYQDSARGYHPQAAHSGHAAMAQTTSPSLNQHNRAAPARTNSSDPGVPIDPSIAAASSPTYPQQHQYSPYPPQHEMQQYAGQPGQPMYAPRPEWAGHYGQPIHAYAPVSAAPGAPGMMAQVARPPAVGAPNGHAYYAFTNVQHQGGHPLSTVYSFVPIPGAQQHKRPRRRYEEIERMYKCGWNGCEKAYGTLNHLNAHVTMQSHGQKRTPEEFKEIRKEWKQKKKEEENQRKAEEERQRQEAASRAQDGTPTQPTPAQYPQQHMMPPQMGGPQLPPIGYQPAGAQAPAQYGGQQPQVDGAQQYAGGQIYASNGGYPASPYAQGGQMYQQRWSARV
ncbi:hypothetical protein M8818_007675 [Zalaria obscura]|uniref:Uncharacterized protein n=1 Tax=Zalaria obscura TaxID=2024903 RepID=A0ACC3S3R9_9PEZI